MKKYLVSYLASDCSTASTVIYAVEKYEDLFELAILDFFNYSNGDVDDEGYDVLQSVEVMREYVESEDFYGTCSKFGIDFGDITPLDEALDYVTTLAEFKD